MFLKNGCLIMNIKNKLYKHMTATGKKIYYDVLDDVVNKYNNTKHSTIEINMYSTYNEGKSVVAERFIRTLKNKLYKHMTATGKKIYYDKNIKVELDLSNYATKDDVLDDVVNKYNNTKHSTIKMKPIDVGDTTKSSSLERNNKRVYIDEHNEKDCRFKVGDRFRISRYKNIFAKGYTPNWSKEIFIVDKVNDTVPYTYNLKDLNDEEIIGSFYDKELQKTEL